MYLANSVTTAIFTRKNIATRPDVVMYHVPELDWLRMFLFLMYEKNSRKPRTISGTPAVVDKKSDCTLFSDVLCTISQPILILDLSGTPLVDAQAFYLKISLTWESTFKAFAKCKQWCHCSCSSIVTLLGLYRVGRCVPKACMERKPCWQSPHIKYCMMTDILFPVKFEQTHVSEVGLQFSGFEPKPLAF